MHHKKPRHCSAGSVRLQGKDEVFSRGTTLLRLILNGFDLNCFILRLSFRRVCVEVCNGFDNFFTRSVESAHLTIGIVL